jgi:hypothetical protein
MTLLVTRLLIATLGNATQVSAGGFVGGGDQLRVLGTRHYRIHTDLDAKLAEEIGQRMDAMYEEYSRRLVEFRGGGGATNLEVYLFRRHEDYLNFTDRKMENSGGVFMPSRNLLAAFLEGQGLDSLRRTLQHEAFHQFADAAISSNLPVWLNEGLAQMFEEGLWTGNGFWIGQVPPRRIRQLQADIKAKRLVRFETLLSITPDEWAKRMSDRVEGAMQYNESWAIVHFLANAPDENGKPRYRQRLVKMLMLLHQGRNARQAFEESFSSNLGGFQDRFLEFAAAMTPTPEAQYFEHMEVLSDMLVEMRTRGKTFTDIDAFQQAATDGRFRLQYTKGQVQWTTQEDPKVYFSDLSGKLFGDDRLRLQARERGGLPDIVCRCTERLQLRARFHELGENKVDREILVEPIAGSARNLGR